ncbi:unnamed protein product [Aspergillus oryzae]|uniref:Unnamed protein product n=1 Tax=Aspergillus oryzae TaxID=5062 RepID=A0AAN4YL88_ASPOZ|nr:unnamed protein product [Aspergillus oryzae]
MPPEMREKSMPHTMAPSESTPLLQVVSVGPQRHRYPHHKLRQFCSFTLGTLLVVSLFLFLLPSAIFPREHGSIWSYFPGARPFPHKAWPQGHGLKYEELQAILQTTPSAEKAREWSSYYTAGPHLAGKNLSQAIWTQERWQEFGIHDTDIVAYDVYINYPLDHRLALLKKSKDTTEVTFEATLEEDVLEEDGTSGLPDRVPTFHGYSATGNVTASFLYVNYGSYQDYQDLVDANVSLSGKIAIAKYGHIFRGLKVKRAQELGMVGVILYDDPEDDGEITEENGYKPYPEGPARNPSASQLINYLSELGFAPGDPTTPGWPSKPGCDRKDPSDAIPSIPSIPISYKEAIPFLKALNGHGPKAADFPKRWQGGKLGSKGVEYNIGPSPDDVVINLDNQQEYVTTPLWNVIGTIKGAIPDEVVILGNHRDAWIAGGAGDPNSGSAVLNEVIRSFGEALKAGWKPLRTIVFASWDGEEYGLLGSTEWVEDKLPWLKKANVAYLNVDVAASGTVLGPRAAPLLNSLIYEVTSLVQSPNQTIEGQTVRDVWDGHIATMGSGSDFTAFQDFAGVASLDLGFGRGPKDPVYHYHSNYDSFDWMDRFGDPGWLYHEACTKLWSLAAAKLVEAPVLSFSASDYSTGLGQYLEKIKPGAKKLRGGEFDFGSLDRAVAEFQATAKKFDAYAADLTSQLGEDLPWYLWWKKVRLYFQIRVVNDKYKALERAFLYEPGLDGRNWFKHVVFAPGLWTGYSGATYPGLVESFDAGDSANAQPEMIEYVGVPKNEVAKWVGISSAVTSISQAIMAVTWGTRFGRKPIILTGLTCTMIISLLFGFSQTLTWVVVTRALLGLMNGNVGIIRTMVAEMVPEKELQPHAFSIMPLVWTIGTIFGPAFGGALAHPAEKHPEIFGNSEFLKRNPFILPNIASAILFIIGNAGNEERQPRLRLGIGQNADELQYFTREESALAASIFGFPCITILLTNSATSLTVLGTLNGVATSVSAVGRAAGPAICGAAFSFGVKKGYIILPWWMLSIFGALSALPIYWTVEPDGFQGNDAEEEQDEPQESDYGAADHRRSSGARTAYSTPNQLPSGAFPQSSLTPIPYHHTITSSHLPLPHHNPPTTTATTPTNQQKNPSIQTTQNGLSHNPNPLHPKPATKLTQEPQKQTLEINSALSLSILTSLGGVIGYARTGSVPSIAAGLSVGALYLYSFQRLRTGQTYGDELGLLASIVLSGSSIPRAIKTRKPVPIGLSLVAIYGLLVFGKAVLGKN